MENKAIKTYLAEKNAIWVSGSFENDTPSKVIERMFPDIPLSLLDSAQENLRKYTSMKNYLTATSAEVTDPMVSQREMSGTYYGGAVRFEWGPPDPSRNETPTVNVIQVLYKGEQVSSYETTRNDCQYKVEETRYRFMKTKPTLPSAEPSNGVWYRITDNRYDGRTGSWTVVIEKWTRLYQHLAKKTIEDNANQKVEEEQHLGAKWVTDHYEKDDGTNLSIPTAKSGSNPSITVNYNLNDDCTSDIVIRWVTVYYRHTAEYKEEEDKTQITTVELYEGVRKDSGKYYEDDGLTIEITTIPDDPKVVNDPTVASGGYSDDTDKVKIVVQERPGANNTWDITVSRTYTKELKGKEEFETRYGTGYRWWGQNVVLKPNYNPSATGDKYSNLDGANALGDNYFFSTWKVRENQFGLYNYFIMAGPIQLDLSGVTYGGSASYSYVKRKYHTQWLKGLPTLWYRDITYTVEISYHGSLTVAANYCDGSKVDTQPVMSQGLWKAVKVTGITDGTWTKQP